MKLSPNVRATIQYFPLLRLQYVCTCIYMYMNKKLESFQQKKTKVVCYIFKDWYIMASSQIQPTISFYKQTFIETLPCLFWYYDCFYTTTAELNSCDRLFITGLQTLKQLYFALHRKSLLTLISFILVKFLPE